MCIDPADSELVIYPAANRELNPFTSAATYYASLPADQKPEVALTADQEVVIKDEPGDVMMFYGSAIWHMRRNSARSVNLYMKFNDFDYDPLGEDPNTIDRQERTKQLLSSNGGSLPADALVKASRQLEWLNQQHSRNDIEVLQAKLWGQDPVLIGADGAPAPAGAERRNAGRAAGPGPRAAAGRARAGRPDRSLTHPCNAYTWRRRRP